MKSRVIYEIEDLDTYGKEILESIDRAVLAAAFKMRDDARTKFLSSDQKKTSRFDSLTKGINVGKLINHQTNINALGTREYYNTYKTRFFVGGTKPRTKGHDRGQLNPNNALESVLDEGLLQKYIQNAIDG